MPVIAIASPKGGVGKTTTCINLGIEIASKGYSVALIDGEFKGTTLYYLDRDSSLPKLDIFAGYDENVDKMIAAYKHAYDYVICDTSGFNPEAANNKQATVNARIISSADLIIIPVTPSPSSFQKTFDFFEYVNGFINASQNRIKAFSFINQYSRQQKLSIAAMEALSGNALPVPLANVTIREAAVVAQAEAELKSINEYKKSSNVASDYRRFVNYVIEKVNNND